MRCLYGQTDNPRQLAANNRVVLVTLDSDRRRRIISRSANPRIRLECSTGVLNNSVQVCPDPIKRHGHDFGVTKRSGSSAGRVLSTICVTESASSAWRSSTISEKHSSKYGSWTNWGKWTDNESARARIQSTDITSTAHHGPSD